MNEIKRISVVGAGALGTLVGALIQRRRPDAEVVLICRGQHYQAMHDRGHAVLHGEWGSYEVPINVSQDLADASGSDLVLFTVKTQDTADTARQLADVVGNAIVVSLQNGINQRVLTELLPNDRLLVGMTATNMTTTEPGVVTLHRNGISIIGAATNQVPSATVDAARQALRWSGLRIESSDNILGVQYNKLLFNTMGYASVIAALDFIREGILDGPWRKNVALPLLNEGMSVLKSAGIRLERLPGGSDVIPLRRIMIALNTPGLDHVVRAVINLFNPPRLVFSVHQDLLRKRPTEIDFVNGEIVRLAHEIGTDAPYNAEVVRIIHDMEASDAATFLARDEVVRRFRDL